MIPKPRPPDPDDELDTIVEFPTLDARLIDLDNEGLGYLINVLYMLSN